MQLFRKLLEPWRCCLRLLPTIDPSRVSHTWGKWYGFLAYGALLELLKEACIYVLWLLMLSGVAFGLLVLILLGSWFAACGLASCGQRLFFIYFAYYVVFVTPRG